MTPYSVFKTKVRRVAIARAGDEVAELPLAKGEDFKPTTRVPARERTYWDTWGQTR